MKNTLHFTIGIFGNAFALFLFLAPLDYLHKDCEEKVYRAVFWNSLYHDSAQLPALCLVYVVSPNNLLVVTINGTGATIESVYVLIYLIFAPKKEKGKIVGLLAAILAFFGTIAFVSMFALHGNGRKLFCGVAATIFSIIMYGSRPDNLVHDTKTRHENDTKI
ncbi:hypothetical protein OROGR_032686 [Orobanche gracilis]